MSEQNYTTREVTGQAHSNGARIGLDAVQHRGFGLHITPIVNELGHVATRVDIVIPGWDPLAGYPHEEAVEIVNSFITDVVEDLHALIANGLAESVVNYITASVQGKGYETPYRVVEDHPENTEEKEV